jgi:uncharacterized UPF0160 family protein
MLQIVGINTARACAKEGSLLIGTHSGPFHADEAGAIGLVEMYREAFALGAVAAVRTRNPAELASIKEAGGVLVDVGGEYVRPKGPDLRGLLADHHQKGGACPPRPNGVPYSSFGLVWREIGPAICRHTMAQLGVPELDEAVVVDTVDEGLVSAIDATDNGAVDTVATVKSTGRPMAHWGVSLVVHQMNPPAIPGLEQNFDEAFMKAVKFMQTCVAAAVVSAIAEEAAKATVRKAISISTGPVLQLDTYVDWQDTVARETTDVLYVIFRNPEGTWMVQQVPKALGSFEGRKPLPAAWAGLRDTALQAVTGVQDAVFCHNGRFIAGAKSREGALRLARLAVEA